MPTRAHFALKHRRIRVKETELRDQLLPLVQGRIFHVARQSYLERILADGRIQHNRDGQLPTTFGSSTISYFRTRSCVCLFDLFHPSKDQQNRHLRDCWPFMPARPGSGIAILMLAVEAHDEVITYAVAKRAGALKEMIVPYVEAGYAGDLPLTLIDEIVEVEVDVVPGSFKDQMRQAGHL